MDDGFDSMGWFDQQNGGAKSVEVKFKVKMSSLRLRQIPQPKVETIRHL